MWGRAENLDAALSVVATELDAPALRARQRRRARACQGEPEGPGRAVARIDRGPHEQARFGDPGARPAASLDEVVARIEAVTIDDLAALVAELWAPERLRAAGIGPEESTRRSQRSSSGRRMSCTPAPAAHRAPPSDQGRGGRRRRPHGRDGLPRRRGRRRHGARRAGRSRAGELGGRRDRPAPRRARRLHDPGHGDSQRDRGAARRRPRRDRDDRL